MCARVRASVLWRGLSTSARELGRRPVHTGRVTALLLGGEGLQFRFLLSLGPHGVCRAPCGAGALEVSVAFTGALRRVSYRVVAGILRDGAHK